ncbi:site-specific integrase [Pseudomonas gregormendelii]|uniref:Site-specific integrase n=1 Tax=Pseudomonas gregormendelii TaxID=1628277 RepID=A0ABS3AIQ1_9PSED|nr:site-specific integrase [Pseudomonas gregormendelii]MBN3966295.1 site-specific integrase [Pseudomonas gregormendelii]
MTTVAVSISEPEIRKHAADPDVTTLRDPRHPGLYMRFAQNRQRGTWYLVHRKKWERIAGYPDLNAKALLGVLPQIRARIAADPAASAVEGTLNTVGELLRWFAERQSRDRSLSSKRRKTAKSAIACHLLPRLMDMPVGSVTRASLDQAVMWPLQEILSLSYVRLMWGVLVVAFLQAFKLKMIATNPIAGFKFTDFTKAKIQPKTSRLRAVQIEAILQQLDTGFDEAPADCMLALMMLCHGTRVGETRQARWAHLTLGEMGEWFIPAENTKTRCEHTLPVTAQVGALLKRYREWQSSRGYTGAYLFPSKNGRCMTEGQACAVFAALGQGEWTSHDLRKVARTAWTDLGVDFLIGEMLVNHTLSRNVQTYIHTSAAVLKRVALEKWHDWLDGKGFFFIHGWMGGRNGNSHNAAEALSGAASSPIKNP